MTHFAVTFDDSLNASLKRTCVCVRVCVCVCVCVRERERESEIERERDIGCMQEGVWVGHKRRGMEKINAS